MHQTLCLWDTVSRSVALSQTPSVAPCGDTVSRSVAPSVALFVAPVHGVLTSRSYCESRSFLIVHLFDCGHSLKPYL